MFSWLICVTLLQCADLKGSTTDSAMITRFNLLLV